MFKQSIRRSLNFLGYDIQKIPASMRNKGRPSTTPPPGVDPVWPLPRREGGPSDEAIHDAFSKYESWHYAYAFTGDVTFSAHHKTAGALIDDPKRAIQRFKHFMPYLLASQNGSLKGKRVLDIACNSGFWSIQCALLGAEVVGFDARPELIEQANLVKSIIGVENIDFKILDFWEMSPQSLGGTFDVVLNFGLLYHLPKPLEALEITRSMAESTILLDTSVYPAKGPIIMLEWEEPEDIEKAQGAGVVAFPSKNSIELMLRHMGATEWFEVPIHSQDMPRDYLDGRRASWLINV